MWNGNNYTASGAYSVTLTNAVGCDSVATLNLTVKSTSTSITNASTCSNQLPYAWNGNNYNTSGTYSVTLTSATGCDSIATLRLFVNNIITTTERQSVCRSQLPYSWNGLNINQPGNYSRLLTGTAGCDSNANLVLSVIDTVFSRLRAVVCSGNLPYVWNGTSYNLSGTYRQELTAASGCDSVAILDLLVREPVTTRTDKTLCASELPYQWQGQALTRSGLYSDTLTDFYGCDSLLNLFLTVLELPSAPRLGNDTLICSGEKLLLSPGNYSSYLWQDNSTASTYLVSAAGTYQVTVSGNNGCTNADTIRVGLLDNCADIVFPSAFSPNNDGKNDRFGPLGNLSLISEYRLSIFNRMGQLVFSSDNPYRKWEGSGVNDLVGAYTWTATYLYKKTMRRMQRGTLVIIK